jgi:hypothetical protein
MVSSHMEPRLRPEHDAVERALKPNAHTENVLFSVMSEVAAIVVKTPEGRYGGSECGYGLTRAQLAEWYSKYSNPHNPKRIVIIIEPHQYDPRTEGLMT